MRLMIILDPIVQFQHGSDIEFMLIFVLFMPLSPNEEMLYSNDDSLLFCPFYLMGHFSQNQLVCSSLHQMFNMASCILLVGNSVNRDGNRGV